MIAELILRFVIGGIVVSFFAMLASRLKPKSYAGLLGAAPSVALATLSLTVLKKGKPYAAIEAHSMILRSTFFFCLCLLSLPTFDAQEIPCPAHNLSCFACLARLRAGLKNEPRVESPFMTTCLSTMLGLAQPAPNR